MPRIRTIKPEFFSSEQLAECSPTARLLFIGMWCFSDDGGVHPASAARLKMEIFPADAISIDEVKALVGELVNRGLIASYEEDGKGFWRVTGWHHQRIEKPTYSYPRSQEFGEQATAIRRQLYDQSSTPPRPVVDPSPPESKGEERSRVESNRKETKSAGVPATADVREEPSFEECEFPIFPCIQGKTNKASSWALEQAYVAELSKAFPGVDVPQECIKAHAWVKTSGENRKTASGMKEFLFRWMTREQNSGRRNTRQAAGPHQQRRPANLPKVES